MSRDSDAAEDIGLAVQGNFYTGKHQRKPANNSRQRKMKLQEIANILNTNIFFKSALDRLLSFRKSSRKVLGPND